MSWVGPRETLRRCVYAARSAGPFQRAPRGPRHTPPVLTAARGIAPRSPHGPYASPGATRFARGGDGCRLLGCRGPPFAHRASRGRRHGRGRRGPRQRQPFICTAQSEIGWGKGGGAAAAEEQGVGARRGSGSSGVGDHPCQEAVPVAPHAADPPAAGGGALDRRIPSRALSPPRPDGASCPRWAGCRADGATPRWGARVGSCGAALAAAEEKPPRPARARGGRADRGLDRSGGGGGAIRAPLGRKLLPIALPR